MALTCLGGLCWWVHSCGLPRSGPHLGPCSLEWLEQGRGVRRPCQARASNSRGNACWGLPDGKEDSCEATTCPDMAWAKASSTGPRPQVSETTHEMCVDQISMVATEQEHVVSGDCFGTPAGETAQTHRRSSPALPGST